MNIEIRPWLEEDAFGLHQMCMHPYYWKERIWKYIYPDTFLHAMSTIHFYQCADPTRFLYRAILHQGELVGYLQCEKKSVSSAELSYWLGVEYWQKGIMQVALAKFCEEVFQTLPVLSLYARVKKSNIASQHVLLANGFNRTRNNHYETYTKYK